VRATASIAAAAVLKRRFAVRPWLDAYDAVYRGAIERAGAR
jgi:hypothetical protein